MQPVNFIGQLKELLDKEPGGDIEYTFDVAVGDALYQCVGTLPAGVLGFTEALRCVGAAHKTKKAAQQSAAELLLSGLQSRREADSQSDTTADTTASEAHDIAKTPSGMATDDGAFTPSVHRILLTGGPCGAKSTGIAMLKQILPGQADVMVQTVDDFLDMSGDKADMVMTPSRMRCIQEERENMALSEAMRCSTRERKLVVLLIDRGVIERVLDAAPPHAPQDVLRRYDMIVHMLSPAADKPEFYQRIDKDGKPPLDDAIEEDLQVRRCYQRHERFQVLWNGPDKGQAIPVWLGWKLKELLRVVLRMCRPQHFPLGSPPHLQLNVVDQWLRCKQLREAFGCEKDVGVQEVHDPLKRLLSKHLDGNEEWVTNFFDHVRFVRPLDSAGFRESLPDSLRSYVASHMPGIIAAEASCECCGEKEKTSGKPERVALELLQVYNEAFKGQPPKVADYADVGSGTCTTASALARQLSLKKENATCLDIVESCGRCVDDVTFKIFDGQTLPLAAASVDLLSFVHVLHHVEPGGSSMFHLLQEAKRVLRPGGVVIVKEHDSPNRHYDLYLEAMHSLKQLVFYSEDPERMPLGSYQSLDEWGITFRRVGLPVVHRKLTGDIYRSVVFILEKIGDGESDAGC